MNMGPDADHSSGCMLLSGFTLDCRVKYDGPTNSAEMGV